MNPADLDHLPELSRPRAVTPLECRTLTNLAEIDTIADAWNSLERRSRGLTLFQSFAWCRSVVAGVLAQPAGKGIPKPRIIVASRAGQIAAIMPLSVIQRGPLMIARHLGEPLAQYCDLLVDGELEDLDPILGHIEAWGDVDALLFRRIRNDARLLPALQKANAVSLATSEAVSAHLQRYKNAEAFGKAMNAGAARDRRRLRRRLEETGSVSFEVVEAGDTARDYAALAISWKIDWLDRRGLRSQAFEDLYWMDILASLTTCPPCGPLVGVLKLDGDPVAIEIGFIQRHRLFAYLGAFSPAHEKSGVGRIVMDEMVQWCFANGIEVYDLLSPAAPYKSQWIDTSTQLHDLAVPMNATGWAYLHGYQRFGRDLLRRAFLAMPASWRAQLAKVA